MGYFRLLGLPTSACSRPGPPISTFNAPPEGGEPTVYWNGLPALTHTAYVTQALYLDNHFVTHVFEI